LTAFLDIGHETAKLLEEVPSPEKCDAKYKALQGLYKDIATPPNGVAWAVDAAAYSKDILDAVNLVSSMMITLKEAMAAVGQSGADSPEARDACHKAADEMRKLIDKARATIPPACLQK
jgi:hypothetical protein